jgi:hypothetical protein
MNKMTKRIAKVLNEDFELEDISEDPHRNMLVALLVRTFEDCLIKQYQRDVIRWVEGDWELSDNFPFWYVCEALGLEADKIKRDVYKLIKYRNDIVKTKTRGKIFVIFERLRECEVKQSFVDTF